MKALRKIRMFFFVVMAMTIAGVAIIMAKTGVRFKDIFAKEKIYMTKPYDLKFKDRQTIYTATSAIDFYIDIHDGENDRDLTAIYSFDMKAGSEFKDMVKWANDTCLIPYPIVKVDQNDFEAPLVLKSKGNLDWNDLLQPVKIAMQKMAESYGRDLVLEPCAEFLEEYFNKWDSKTYKVDRSDRPQKEIIDIPNLPIVIDFYRDLLQGTYNSHCSDSIFERNSLVFYDQSDKLFSLSYWQPWNGSFDLTNDLLKDCFVNYIKIVDPINPTEKIICIGTDQDKNITAVVSIGGYMYLVESRPRDNVNPVTYWSDLFYLISCIHTKTEYSINQTYIDWAHYYDHCIEQINDNNLGVATRFLANMENLQSKGVSQDELYLKALVSVLRGKQLANNTNDDSFDCMASAYYDIVYNSGCGLMDSESEREELFSCINRLEDNVNQTITSELERYFIEKTYECSPDETEKYISDIIEKGDVVDASILKKMDDEQFLNYLYSTLFNSFNHEFEKDSGHYDRNAFKDIYPEVHMNVMNGQKLLIVRDLKLWDDYKKGVEYYGATDEEIIKRLRKKGFANDKDPCFILLITQDRRLLGGKDKDALLFSREYLFHIPNYDGVLGKKAIAELQYDKINTNRSSKNFNLNNAEYSIDDPVVKEMVSRLVDAYKAHYSEEKYNGIIKNKFGQFLISYVNDYLNPVPFDYNYTPITLDLMK